MRLPDVEFLINLGDWPLVRKSDEDIARDVPMLSWCKTNDTNDILLPTYELTEASTECMGRYNAFTNLFRTKKRVFLFFFKIGKSWTCCPLKARPTFPGTRGKTRLSSRAGRHIFPYKHLVFRNCIFLKIIRDSSRERLKLARLAKSHPHLIEGGITRYFFFRDEEDR